MRTRGVVAVGVVCCLGLFGCDFTKITANGTSGLFQRAAPAFEQHWDYDLAGGAMPGNIVQMEGLLRIVPENEIIVMNAVRLYTAYAYGWIEDRVEVLQGQNDYAGAEEQLRRARYMYLRARDLAKHRIAIDHEGFEEAYQGGLETFQRWLQEEFEDEDDVEGIFWAGYAWGSYINTSKHDMVAVADLPFAQALVDRAVELDPDYFNGAGLIFRAVVATEAPGADLDAAEPLWTRALEVTERKNLLAIVNMARTYAVKRQDREMYVSLLREVLEAGDVAPEQRLTNMIAKRRAARYLRLVDERFPR
ncbi:MAG: hypothetical protein H6722_13490 [Sandaracinus sp.]|nr:hypothetical protein [Sandaracinus sp.]